MQRIVFLPVVEILLYPTAKFYRIVLALSPAGAEIELNGTFVGSTPSTITGTAGDHTITLKKSGFKPWERKIRVSGGNIQISAELQASEGTQTQPAQ